jgi:hypothetical protein
MNPLIFIIVWGAWKCTNPEYDMPVGLALIGVTLVWMKEAWSPTKAVQQ